MNLGKKRCELFNTVQRAENGWRACEEYMIMAPPPQKIQEKREKPSQHTIETLKENARHRNKSQNSVFDERKKRKRKEKRKWDIRKFSLELLIRLPVLFNSNIQDTRKNTAHINTSWVSSFQQHNIFRNFRMPKEWKFIRIQFLYLCLYLYLFLLIFCVDFCM